MKNEPNCDECPRVSCKGCQFEHGESKQKPPRENHMTVEGMLRAGLTVLVQNRKTGEYELA